MVPRHAETVASGSGSTRVRRDRRGAVGAEPSERSQTRQRRLLRLPRRSSEIRSRRPSPLQSGRLMELAFASDAEISFFSCRDSFRNSSLREEKSVRLFLCQWKPFAHLFEKLTS
ncbi:hypothetical protein EYF80_050410 [Liparis tanakae]|uniref:Uncharacterized protein n=1 Tax=Liparis tanakae TaxID=230148 RepID=A0A4Z2FEU0_9TELE|nr:hypothetical protein EYF80_050410 [Liparis tanakae]